MYDIICRRLYMVSTNAPAPEFSHHRRDMRSPTSKRESLASPRSLASPKSLISPRVVAFNERRMFNFKHVTEATGSTPATQSNTLPTPQDTYTVRPFDSMRR